MYQIYGLKCSGMKDPRGITIKNPEFSWKLRSDEKGRSQKAYQIRVWDPDGACVWDSGIRRGSDVFGIRYEGNALKPHTLYKWQVLTVSSYEEKALSDPAYFVTGMLDAAWKASWVEANQKRRPRQDCTDIWKIMGGEFESSKNPEEFLNPAVCMRKELRIDKEVKAAYLYATARGIYQIKVDGREVSELFAPGYTAYHGYLEVQQYDVTQLLPRGSHTLAVTLADGWFTGKIGLYGIGNQFGETNAFYMQMEIEYIDGMRQTVVTDRSFKWRESAYKYADLFVGSCYYQGSMDSAWELPGYDDSKWEPVLEKTYPTESFRGREAEPVKIIRRLGVKEVMQTPNGELVIDVGENIVGVLQIRFQGRVNTVLKLEHSETLDKEGNFFRNIVGQNKHQTDVYVCDRESEVTYLPEFTFHGFRYVRVEGIGREQILGLEVLVYGTDLEKTGDFKCSDERLNQLQKNIFRSQQGNMLSIPTDCPQREKAGWTGDMQVYSPTAGFNMDVYSFLKKWLANMRLDQLPDGQIPDIIPMTPSEKIPEGDRVFHDSSAAWGDGCLIIPYVLYQKYGRKEILEENFDMMNRWMDYIERTAASEHPKLENEYSGEELERQKYLWNTGFHFGDWLYPSASVGMTDPFKSAFQTKEYVSAAFWAYTTRMMADISRILGEEEKRMHYLGLNENIRKAYAKEYIDEEGNLPLELQGLYVLGLAFELFPKEKKAHAIRKLANLIHQNGDCLDTGFASVSFLLDTLWDHGEKELAWKLLFQDRCPSWLYEVKQGATTIWETWNAVLPDGTRTVSSFNHFSYGCVGDFMYRKILGLNAAEPGYRKIKIDLEIPEVLDFAKGSYDSVYGEIDIFWKKENSQIKADIMLPPNVTGVLNVLGKQYVLESGRTQICRVY
ncbi:MAG: glycoside hydrolase family 78 protein [Lachnospiraceae bacterium]|nr:glycoside hydrolase family 78 protein [Lachnospiraceae bacterium]